METILWIKRYIKWIQFYLLLSFTLGLFPHLSDAVRLQMCYEIGKISPETFKGQSMIPEKEKRVCIFKLDLQFQNKKFLFYRKDPCSQSSHSQAIE